MKFFYSLFLAALFISNLFAQVPQKMSYQAMIRNSDNALITNHAVRMRVSILQGSATGTPVYAEIQSSTTNSNGLVSVEIGGGVVVTGIFEDIDWSSGLYYIKTETDPTGGTNYTITGTTQLLSVPFSLYAKAAENGFSGNYIDLTNKPVIFDGNWSGLTGKPTTVNGYGITDAMRTSHPANEISELVKQQWNLAFSWGNHAGLYKQIGYVPAWTEITSNPFSFSAPSNNQLLRYNLSSAKWENWTPNFISDYTESDPMVRIINGIIKSDGATISVAQAGTDYLLPAGNGAGLTGITYTQTGAASAGHNHSGVYEPVIAAGTSIQYFRGDKTWQTLDKSSIGLASVENTALSTWSGSSNLTSLGSIVSGSWNAGSITSSGAITGNSIVKAGGTSSQFLKADGSVDGSTYLTAVREVADEFSATASQTSFTLSQSPSSNSKIKMFINGIRISNSAYTNIGAALTYIPANNGLFSLVAGDRVQFDYNY